MKNIFQWIVYSSKDPSKYSLTIKATLGGAVTALTMVLGLANIPVPGDADALVDAIVVLVQALFALVSAVAFVWGLIRKTYLTATGQNDTPML